VVQQWTPTGPGSTPPGSAGAAFFSTDSSVPTGQQLVQMGSSPQQQTQGMLGGATPPGNFHVCIILFSFLTIFFLVFFQFWYLLLF